MPSPNASQPIVKGPIDRVPCPWCGKPNDFRLLQEQQLLDTGHKCYCDHCGNSMEVAAVRPVVVVAVRQNHEPDQRRGGQRGIPAGQQPQPRQIQQGRPQQQPRQGGIGGFVRNLLGAPPKR